MFETTRNIVVPNSKHKAYFENVTIDSHTLGDPSSMQPTVICDRLTPTTIQSSFTCNHKFPKILERLEHGTAEVLQKQEYEALSSGLVPQWTRAPASAPALTPASDRALARASAMIPTRTGATFLGTSARNFLTLHRQNNRK